MPGRKIEQGVYLKVIQSTLLAWHNLWRGRYGLRFGWSSLALLCFGTPVLCLTDLLLWKEVWMSNVRNSFLLLKVSSFGFGPHIQITTKQIALMLTWKMSSLSLNLGATSSKWLCPSLLWEWAGVLSPRSWLRVPCWYVLFACQCWQLRLSLCLRWLFGRLVFTGFKKPVLGGLTPTTMRFAFLTVTNFDIRFMISWFMWPFQPRFGSFSLTLPCVGESDLLRLRLLGNKQPLLTNLKICNPTLWSSTIVAFHFSSVTKLVQHIHLPIHESFSQHTVH